MKKQISAEEDTRRTIKLGEACVRIVDYFASMYPNNETGKVLAGCYRDMVAKIIKSCEEDDARLKEFKRIAKETNNK